MHVEALEMGRGGAGCHMRGLGWGLPQSWAHSQDRPMYMHLALCPHRIAP